MIYQRLNISRT
uniref:Uncharacterized protein n=1 Tax=Rhizophora mucronata TaxID=61149 RepID=A0A2P2NNU3_RHIMU